jgi:hypothetical protein
MGAQDVLVFYPSRQRLADSYLALSALKRCLRYRLRSAQTSYSNGRVRAMSARMCPDEEVDAAGREDHGESKFATGMVLPTRMSAANKEAFSSILLPM